MRRFARFLFVVGFLGLAGASASAQDRRQNEPGKFDFYLLALSWSPTFCEERGDSRNAQTQCGERPFSFVVHGLWPQYEKGFPESCQNPPEFVDSRIISSMLDLMPARGLIINEWRKHGTCSGLGPRAYFDAVRQVRAAIKIPPDYLDLKKPLTVTPDEVEEAFVKVNPGMSRTGIAVTCSSTRLSEVRICLTRDFKFRDCHEVDRRACRRDKLVMPPVRGG
jgi:ribonuclease T2